MNIVNNWIYEHYNSHIFNLLLDDNFKDYYENCLPFIKNSEILINILSNNNVTRRQINKIINEYFFNLVPADIKKDKKEKEFINIIKQRVEVELNNYTFYSNKSDCDWLIINNETGDKLYGFIYPHLFYGDSPQLGLQKLKNNISRDKKVLNILLNYKRFTDESDKAIAIIEDGIRKGNICYITNIIDCIRRII